MDVQKLTSEINAMLLTGSSRKRATSVLSSSSKFLIQKGSTESLSSDGDSDTTVESIDLACSSSDDEEDVEHYKSYDDEVPVAEEIEEGGLRKRARAVLDDVFSLEFDYALGAGFDIESSQRASPDESDAPLSTGSSPPLRWSS